MSIEDIQFFDHDGIKLAWREAGNGPVVLLIHGFASSGYMNWISTGWVDLLVNQGYRVIVVDNRGHGFSEKIYDEKAYRPELMAEDVAALLDHLQIRTAHVMGYSLGAKISAYLAISRPDLVHSLVFGGMGIGLIAGTGDWQPIYDALLAEDIRMITDPRGKMFRIFAEHTKSDLKALAACVITSKRVMREEDIEKISAPTLVIVGSDDEIGGDPFHLVPYLQNGEGFVLIGRNHMLAVADKLYKEKVVEFFTKYAIL